MKLPMNLTIALLAGLSCLASWPGINIPVWAIFIGWAWYYALGATPDILKKIYASLLPGIATSVLCIAAINYMISLHISAMLAIIISVIITVYVLLLLLQMPCMNSSLPAFNAYSTVFAVYYGGFYPDTDGPDISLAVLWAATGLCTGPLLGYISIVCSRK
ncbi:TPA: DUF1097 domain-containing protein [Escherichia coli]